LHIAAQKMPSGSSKSKPKPADVAAETKKQLIPTVRNKYAQFNIFSYIYHHPLSQLNFLERPLDLSPPRFCEWQATLSPSRTRLMPASYLDVNIGDPADGALNWASETQICIPFICPANDQRPGGDWETGAAGYEERLCRRSTLSATLATPGPGSRVDCHYPIPMYGGILSADVGTSP
jgi:hypothetical protein